MSARTATVTRETSETSISCTITLDNVPGVTEQKIEVSTGIGFLDHVSEETREDMGRRIEGKDICILCHLHEISVFMAVPANDLPCRSQ